MTAVALGLTDQGGAGVAVHAARGEPRQLRLDVVQVVGHRQLPPNRSRSRESPRLTRLRTTISEQLSSEAMSL